MPVVSRSGSWRGYGGGGGFGAVVLLGCVWLLGAEVKIVNLPEGALVPDVLVDKGRIVHVVYGLGENAYYVRSADNGRTFSEPLRVNPAGSSVEFAMGERGPKLALGANDSVQVVWVDRWSAGSKVYVRHARTLNGKTFEASQQVSAMAGVDGATVAADGLGNVLVFWHVAEPVQEETPQAHYIYMSSSTNDGRTFSEGKRVEAGEWPELACSMCMMRARIVDGQVYLALRVADNNIRDLCVMRSPVGENRFSALRVNEDHWKIETSPMNGPELTVAPDGTLIAAFMSKRKAYWAAAERPYNRFRFHIQTPANEEEEIYPGAFANADAKVLFVWQVGPMSTTGKATVKYALYTQDGKRIGDEVTVGTTTSGTKATAFVGSDDNFHIVTTARP